LNIRDKHSRSPEFLWLTPNLNICGAPRKNLFPDMSHSISVDLSNCDCEPIHIPGAIQRHGAMLVVDPVTQQLQHASANIAAVTGYTGNLIPGIDLSSIVGKKNTHDLRNAAAKARAPGLSSVVLGMRFGGTATLYDATVHTFADRTFIEFEPCPDRGKSARQALDLTRSVIHRIGQEDTTERITATGARLIRAMLGYDRVMVYRFLHNGAGRVIAEAKSPLMGSFMGQHFPASDIPAQARRLYLANTIRMISDTEYQPIPLLPAGSCDRPAVDMSHAQLRSVSPVHCQYLRNMGVAASLSVSIVVDGELWGLISCHHNTPRVTPLALRIGAELFGQYFSLHIAACERRQTLRATAEARTRLDNLVSKMRMGDALRESLAEELAQLNQMVPCDGVALWMNGCWTALGDTLDRDQTLQLIARAQDRSALDIWAVQDAGSYLPGLESPVAGVMAVPLSVTFGDYLVFFRNEESYRIEWAGEPVKKCDGPASDNRLTPRGSFEIWREEVRGRATPWTPVDFSVSQAIGTYLRDVLLQQNEIAEKERARTEERRRILNAELNHRVKNILALVRSIARQTGAGSNSVADYSKALEGRLRALSSVHDQSLASESGGTIHTLIKAETALYGRDDRATRFGISGPPLTLDQRAYSVLALVLHEMMTNAAKYGAMSVPQGQISIEWTRLSSGDCVILWQEQGGPSVPPPGRSGFGSRLIQSAFIHDLSGQADITYAPDGLHARFVIPAIHVSDGAAAVPSAPHISEQPALSLQGSTVLVVEDQSLIALDLEDSLLRLGADSVWLAANSASALEKLATESPHFAIIDYNLAHTTSEDVALHLLRRGVPFVFVSGYSKIARLADDLQNITVLQKPVDEATLHAALADLLR
jgi:light-regulated signal transduction histidine kinase (bacteriophytochrome)/CheY-like chemotaxis protein